MKKGIFLVLLVMVPLLGGNTLRINNIVRVYDGDTFYVNLKGVPDIFGDTLGNRINGIDTPEIRGSDVCVKKIAYAARDYAKKLLTEAKTVELKNVERGKYFRVVADVYVNGESLADLMIKKGYAKPYDGGTKSDWVCEE